MMFATMMVNRLYFVSSLFFISGSAMAFRAVPSAVNALYVLGSIFFFFAAVSGMMSKAK